MIIDRAPAFFKQVMEEMGVDPKPHVDEILAIINGETPDSPNYDRLHEAFLASQKLKDEFAPNLGRTYCEYLLKRIRPIPEWGVEILRYRTRSEIEAHHNYFEATKNPLHALKAYKEARQIGDLPPEWVLVYLDEGINTFLATYRRRKAQANIADAFGKTFRISKMMIRSYYNLDALAIGWRAIAIARKRGRAALPINESAVIFEAAAELSKKMSDASIWRAWRLYKKCHPRAVEAFGRWCRMSELKCRLSKIPRISDTDDPGSCQPHVNNSEPSSLREALDGSPGRSIDRSNGTAA